MRINISRINVRVVGGLYMDVTQYPEQMVFGLDIGTRSIVGTVGFMENENKFVVVSQSLREHETRAMLDGQIHDINKVALTIQAIKKELEKNLNRRLTEVCIAAAGRVLKTITVDVAYEFSTETTVNMEHIRSLELLGVEKAYDTIKQEGTSSKSNFYCVGYTVIKYYLNDLAISNLEGHKAISISTQLIATFLPDDVIDGLYTAVERAGLRVANLTLEPIAAINIAIPEKFRLLNIALVDVGAGTSDICITKDGSITGYGMIPYAGDEITEVIMHEYLVEFDVAEKIKLACLNEKTVTYKDIMGLEQKITTEEVKEKLQIVMNTITEKIGEKIRKLNGGKAVSAVFVVGGGGKIPGFTEKLAKHLQIPNERVALRGEEVLSTVQMLQEEIKKDPLLVTPIGICMNYYEQKNNFIFVSINQERIKLYDNNKLTVVNAALQIGFPNTDLFPQRGDGIEFTVNGTKRVVRGEVGEAAVVYLNGKEASINTAIAQNDIIEIQSSTKGKPAEYEVRQLPEYNSTIQFVFNGQTIECPRYVSVNGTLVSGYYKLQQGDEIQILNYYTLEQILQFMDIEYYGEVQVNHVPVDFEEEVYENFTITCRLDQSKEGMIEQADRKPRETKFKKEENRDRKMVENTKEDATVNTLCVSVNSTKITMNGKQTYVLVDVLDYYPFDLEKAKNASLVLEVNNEKADFTTPIKNDDEIRLYWRE